jgi:hypothetical protein
MPQIICAVEASYGTGALLQLPCQHWYLGACTLFICAICWQLLSTVTQLL